MPLSQLPDENTTDVSQSPVQANEANRKQLKQIYISLILIGLAVGGVLSVGIVFAMNRFGLTARPAPVEQSSMQKQFNPGGTEPIQA